MPQIKWSKKDVIAAFERAMVGQTTEQSTLPNLAKQVERMALKNKRIK